MPAERERRRKSKAPRKRCLWILQKKTSQVRIYLVGACAQFRKQFSRALVRAPTASLPVISSSAFFHHYRDMDGIHAGPRFPPEIWTGCWSSSSTQDLRRLALVCRLFRDICQPLLFCYQRFTPPDRRQDSTTRDHSFSRSILRLKHLRASTHVASVRSWDFHGSVDRWDLVLMDQRTNMVDTYVPSLPSSGFRMDEWDYAKCARSTDTDTYAGVLRAFNATLSAYQNLRSLHLAHLTIDTPFRNTLSGLERLAQLTLSSCDIKSRTGSLLALEAFRLERLRPDFGMLCDQPLHLVSPTTLRKLSIDGCRDSRALLSLIGNQPHIYPRLVDFSIELSDSAVPSFLRFLHRCPQLRRLEISGLTKAKTLPHRLSPATIPHLSLFRGSPLLAEFFIRDRPVATLELVASTSASQTPVEDVHRALEDIVLLPVPVHSMSLVFRDYILPLIPTPFANLGEFALDLARDNSTVCTDSDVTAIMVR